MQVTETLSDGLKRGYSITVSAAEIAAKVDEKLKEAQPQVEMKGFRKGKVPLPLLKKQFGPRIMGEVMQETVDGAMADHFEQTGDRPAMQPDVKMTNENWKEGDDVQVAIVPTRSSRRIPEVDLSDIALDKLVVEPGDDAVNEALESLAESAQVFEDKPDGEKAEDGDQVVIDFRRQDRRRALRRRRCRGLSARARIGQFHPRVRERPAGRDRRRGQGCDRELPRGIRGRAPRGQGSRLLVHGEGGEKAGQGRGGRRACQSAMAPDDLDALKTQIVDRLKAEYGSAARAVMKRALLDALDAKVSFELPPSLVDAEAGQIAHQLWHEENPEVEGHDHPEIEPTEEHRALAERRVRLGLLLAELGQKAEIQVTDAELTQAIVNQARQYLRDRSDKFFRLSSTSRNAICAAAVLRAPIFEDKSCRTNIFQLALVRVTRNLHVGFPRKTLPKGGRSLSKKTEVQAA